MPYASRAFMALILSTSLAVCAQAQVEPTDPLEAIAAADIPGDFTAAMEDATEGRALFLAGDHAVALTLLRPLADAGNPVAQNIMGIALTDLNGAYLPYDAAEGFRYLIAAGEQGFAPAMHNLGDTYEEIHEGFAPNLEESFRWYLTAAELDYVTAFHNVGHALVNANGVEEDIPAGRVWLERALDGPERSLALGTLGNLAYFGTGQDVDLALALDYYEQSAAAGSAEAAYYAGYQYYWGEGTDYDTNTALPLLEQAVAGDISGAFAFLAVILADGTDLHPADPDRALQMALRGDDLGLGNASAILGDLYRRGIGTPVDYDLARSAYERGQERGDSDAIYQLGDLAYFGNGEPASYSRALSFYHDALEVDPAHASSLYSVAYMQMRGEGTDVDIASATAILEQSIALRHTSSIIEAIELFGSPRFAGAQTDQVRAQAHCLYIEAQGWPVNGGDTENHRETCVRLAEELSAEDQARAAEMAEAL